MDGLLIAEQLRLLETPAERLSWRFPDAHTFVLPLREGALWLYNRPPEARLAHRSGAPSPDGTHSGFQDLLVAKAAGRLESAHQLKLDRVVKFHFAASAGFVTSPPVTLIAELTGRNCNLILVDEDGVILGVAREVGADINRFRQLRAGLAYAPPPPYDKCDPRTASDEALTATLTGQPLKMLWKLVDGFGPTLTRTLAARLGLPLEHVLEPAEMPRVPAELRRIAAQPSQVLEEVSSHPDIPALRREETREKLLSGLKAHFGREQRLWQRRAQDSARAKEAAESAATLRSQAELLLAYPHQVAPKTDSVTLTDFSGEPVTISLDPKFDAASNAQRLYARAKKLEQRRVQAEAREEEVETALADVKEHLERLEALGEGELETLARTHLRPEKTQFRSTPGMRFESPQGFTVLVGRNARDNDTLTFRVARSLDVWLHAQGYPGSHVINQAQGKEIPFETVLFASRLAAAHSKASQSANVPVDYTLKKNVWKPKGATPGAAYMTQQKTVYVTPSRNPAGEKGKG